MIQSVSRISWSTCIVFLAACLCAQAGDLPSRIEPYVLDSGKLDNRSDRAVIVFSHTIDLGDQISSVRVPFEDFSLPPGSFIQVTSLLDGEFQMLDAIAVVQWGETASFNGGAVLVELVAGPRTYGNRLRLTNVWVDDAGTRTEGPCEEGWWIFDEDPAKPEALDDDRALSNDKRVARLATELDEVPVGLCTTFMIDVCAGTADKLYLSNGHCFGDVEYYQNLPTDFEADISFQVPPSDENCSFNDSATIDRFNVDKRTVITGTGNGRDWAVFRCHPNATTGKTTYERAKELDMSTSAFPLVALPASLPCQPPENPDVNTCLRVTGYGNDGNDGSTDPDGPLACCCSEGETEGERANVQQSAVGPLVPPGFCSTIPFYFAVDSCKGNSGSPVIINQLNADDSSSGEVVGILSGAACAPLQGGTQATLSELTAAIFALTQPSYLCDTVHSEGNNILSITPLIGAGTTDAMALRVTSADWPCTAYKWVQDTDGNLGDPEVSKTPSDWGTVQVHGPEVVSNKTTELGYAVAKKVGTVLSALGSTTMPVWGDLARNGSVDFEDINYILAAYPDFDPCRYFPASNIYPCGAACPSPPPSSPAIIDVDDLLEVLNAFSGVPPYPCPTPCPCSPPCTSPAMGPESPGGPKPAGLTEGAQITLIASETAAPSGATVRVDVYLIGVVDLRGYQITLTPGGGDSGELELIDLTIEPGRANGVFDGLDTYFAYDRFRGRLVSCLASGGVDGSSPQYLATFTYRLSADAVGSFRIEVPLDGTMLRDSGAQPIAIASAPSVEINVAAGHAGQTWPRKGETP